RHAPRYGAGGVRRGLVVRDAHGALVGRVFGRTSIGGEAALSVVRQIDSTPVEFFVRPEGFLREDDSAIFYTTPDCSGQGFIGDSAPTTVFLSRATVVRD